MAQHIASRHNHATSVVKNAVVKNPVAKNMDRLPLKKGEPVFQDKAHFRKHFQTLLRILPSKLKKSERIFRLAVQQKEILQAETVMIYLDMAEEVKTWQLLTWLSDHGKRIFVPVWQKRENLIIPLEIKDLAQFTDYYHRVSSHKITLTRSLLWDDLELGQKFKELFQQSIQTVPKLDLIFLPGLAFDVSGYRLGRGFGTFDRFLEHQTDALKVGLAYSAQVVDSLPTDSWDVQMDLLISEDLVLYCS